MRRSVHLIIPTLLLALGLLAPLDAEARFNLRGRLTKASSWLKARTSGFKGFRKAAPAPKMITAPKSMASSSTKARPGANGDISRMQVEVFIESFKKAPKELILDFDGTDDPVHGEQLGAYFHGYYDHHCFLPLYVFCDQKLLVSYLRPSNIDGAKHAWAILSLLVKRLRQAWPDVHIIFRGDSGFCRHKMFNWCERNNVSYIVGIAKNNRLNEQSKKLHQKARRQFEETEEKQRLFGEVYYAAQTWSRRRQRLGGCAGSRLAPPR